MKPSFSILKVNIHQAYRQVCFIFKDCKSRLPTVAINRSDVLNIKLFVIDQLIGWCVTPTLVGVQLYLVVNKCYNGTTIRVNLTITYFNIDEAFVFYSKGKYPSSL
jgi:hypothetical protein